MNTKKQTLDCQIRWLVRRDLLEILAIERESFAFPWGEDEFCRILRHREVIGLVAVDPATQSVAGYMIYRLGKRSLEVLSLATSSFYRRQGIASQLLSKLLGKLSPGRRSAILANVWERNRPALAFFASQGFLAESVERDAYENNPGDDAYQMVFRLPVFNSTNRISKYFAE
jgi:ribosomal-protein-alanine N-acetyltransferase